jgi:hypothetical protein
MDGSPFSRRAFPASLWASKHNETSYLDKEPGTAAEDPILAGAAKSAWDSFSSSSVYRTMLLTGALFSSPKVRDMLNPAILMGAFLLAWAAYAYESRFNALADTVTPKRQAAMQALRRGKASLLSLSSTTTTAEVELLAADYEQLLREELAVRVIIPGIWVLEMDPIDRDNARQLLKMEVTNDYKLEPILPKR